MQIHFSAKFILKLIMVRGNGTGSKNSIVYLDRANFSGYKILSFWANPQKYMCIKNISTHKEIVTSRSVLNLFVASTNHMARNKINGDIHLKMCIILIIT